MEFETSQMKKAAKFFLARNAGDFGL